MGEGAGDASGAGRRGLSMRRRRYEVSALETPSLSVLRTRFFMTVWYIGAALVLFCGGHRGPVQDGVIGRGCAFVILWRLQTPYLFMMVWVKPELRFRLFFRGQILA